MCARTCAHKYATNLTQSLLASLGRVCACVCVRTCTLIYLYIYTSRPSESKIASSGLMQIHKHMWHVWPHFGIQITKLYKSTPHDCFNLTRSRAWAEDEAGAAVGAGAGAGTGDGDGVSTLLGKYWHKDSSYSCSCHCCWLCCGWQRLETHPTRNQRQSALDTCTNYGDRLQAGQEKEEEEEAGVGSRQHER